MREIKFRGMCNEGTWQHGQLIYRCGYGPSYKKWEIAFIYPDYCHAPKPKIGQFLVEVDVKSVGQYTGFKDANGVEIYEGDILIDTYETTNNKEIIYEVVFKNGAFFVVNEQRLYEGLCEVLLQNRLKHSVCRIIGNIYEGIIKND